MDYLFVGKIPRQIFFLSFTGGVSSKIFVGNFIFSSSEKKKSNNQMPWETKVGN